MNVLLIPTRSNSSNIRGNNSDLVIIKLYLYDGSNTYVLTETTIPALTTLVLDDNLNFNSRIFDLKIDTSTTAEITVIIK